MTPQTDPLWPICSEHTEKHWCEQVRLALINGKDADSITTGMRYCVPIVPAQNLFAEVSIDTDWIVPDVCANVSLVMGTDWTTDTEVLVPVGMWTKGEGRMIFSSVLHSWALGVAEEKCKASSHSLPQEMALEQGVKEANPTFLLSNSWCMAFEKRCYPCHHTETTKAARTAAAPFNFDAASFGLDGVGANRDFSSGNRANNTRNALQARFGGRA